MPIAIVTFSNAVVPKLDVRGWVIAGNLEHARLQAQAAMHHGLQTYLRKMEKLPEPGAYQAAPHTLVLVTPADPGQEHSMLILPNTQVAR